MINPFIALARDPILALAALGYGLALLAIGVVGASYAIRTLGEQVATFRNQRHQSQWWSFGESSRGWIPPADWAARTAWALLVLAATAWAWGALVWLVGGGLA